MDMAKIAVNGQLNYWIRSRLVSGDFGKEEFLIEEVTAVKGEVKTTWTFSLKPNFKAPKMEKLNISYEFKEWIGRRITFRTMPYF